MRLLLRVLILLSAVSAGAADAADAANSGARSFVIEDMEVEGLKRAGISEVFAALPVKVGDYFDLSRTPEMINSLYKLGFFEDVILRREGGVLVFVVRERPGIAEVMIEGNKAIPEEALTEGLQDINIASGRIYDRAAFWRLKQELKQQYYALGKYSVKLRLETTELPDNQLRLMISIEEGDTAIIRDVEIFGNTRIDDDEIRDRFVSGRRKWYDFWSNRNRYSKFKLQGDLETLHNSYLNLGYLDFSVDETRITLTPDKRYIDIAIVVSEGRPYRVAEVNLTGISLPERAALQQSITVQKGEVFSREKTIASSDAVTRQLKNRGYAFAKTSVIPETRPETSTVDLAFFVEPGKLTYIRRIDFHGNDTTNDEVFRRELRVVEGSPYSADRIELSRRRLQRLSYVVSASIEEQAVDEKDDQLDLDIEMSERLSGNFNIGAGYSDNEGGVLSLGVAQDNFLGTGNRISFAFNNSSSRTRYGIGVFNPYHTLDGISRSWNANYTSTEHDEQDTSAVDTDRLTLGLSYGIPLSEEDTLNLGVEWQDVRLSGNADDVRECLGREDDLYDSYDYINYSLNSSFVYDTRDRSLFTTEGSRIRGSSEFFGPGGWLKYYKLNYAHRHYFPLDKDNDFIFAPQLILSYANTYGNTPEVPCYDRFFAGGTRTVRGYQSNSLSPRDSNDDPEGGNFRTIGNFDLFVPTDFLYDQTRLRMSLFTDIGYAFEEVNDFSFDELRGSMGLNIHWLTVIGAINFNFATHYNDKPDDDTEFFQFDFGANF